MKVSAIFWVFCATLLASYGDGRRCGYKPNVRIVGGTEAPQGAWPWQAQLRAIYTSSDEQYCGGTLVAPQWLVTAAHCVTGMKPSDFKVRLGAHLRNGFVGTEQDFEVAKIISHDSHHVPVANAYDIAMVKLKRPARLDRAVNLACLPQSGGRVKNRKMCWVTGFGKLSSGGPYATSLMQVEVPIVSDNKCAAGYGSDLHESMICAGYKEGGKDSCQADSGGPLVCERNGQFVLEGVVSWGHGCAWPKKYGVYANVRFLKQWIDDTMKNN